MSSFKELSRRAVCFSDEGIACGPAGSTAFMGEIVVDMDGQRIFLHGEWVDIVGEYFFQADTESLIDAYAKLFEASSEEEEQKAIAERDRIIEGKIKDDSIFESYYVELKQMLHDEMNSNGFGFIVGEEEYE